MSADYARKWTVTLLSGVSAENNNRMRFWGTAREVSDWACGLLLDDQAGDSPEYHGYSIAEKTREEIEA